MLLTLIDMDLNSYISGLVRAQYGHIMIAGKAEACAGFCLKRDNVTRFAWLNLVPVSIERSRDIRKS